MLLHLLGSVRKYPSNGRLTGHGMTVLQGNQIKRPIAKYTDRSDGGYVERPKVGRWPYSDLQHRRTLNANAIFQRSNATGHNRSSTCWQATSGLKTWLMLRDRSMSGYNTDNQPPST